MISDIRRLLGSIRVTERNGVIQVTDIPANVMAQDVSRIWKTSRINTYMFKAMGRSHFSFSLFFGIDVVYLLRRVAIDSKSVIARRAAASIADEIDAFLWEKRADATGEIRSILDIRKTSLFKKNPLPHQEEFLQQYDEVVPKYELNGYMLAAPPGAGKTLTCLYTHEARGNDVFIAIVPKNSVNRVWEKALLEEYKKPVTNYWISSDSADPTPDKDAYICHYESLPRLMAIMDKLKRKSVTIALDESHNFNEIKSQRTENFVEFCQVLGSTDIIWSSGTPLKAMGSEMIPFLSTTDRYFDKDTETRFKKIYGMSVARANDILANRLGIVSYRVEKAKVVTQDPIEETLKISFPGGEKYTLGVIREQMVAYIKERIDHYHELLPEYEKVFYLCVEEAGMSLKRTGPEYQAYEAYLKDIRQLKKIRDYQSHAELIMRVNQYERNVLMPNMSKDTKKDFERVKSVVKYIPLKVRGEALGNILGRARVNCHVDMLEHIDFPFIIDGAAKKTLIFTSYVDVVKTSQEILAKLNYKPLAVYGETNKDLNRLVSTFANDEKVNPLVATYQSLSTAVPMIMANVCIILNQPFRAHERDQAVSRIHRLGQDTQVYFISILLDTGDEPNVSTRSNDIMEWSQRQVEEMMGIKSEASVEGWRLNDPEAELATLWRSSESFLGVKPKAKQAWASW